MLIEKEKVPIESWYRKRTKTFYVYTLIYFFIGIELGTTTSTLWIYVSTLLHTDNPLLYYGLIHGAYFIPSLWFPPLISRLVDRTRRAKLSITIVNFVVMAGSILYLVQWSPFYPMAGRFLNGFIQALSPIVLSEIARSYPPDETPHKIPVLYSLRMLGFGIGPIITIFFLKTDFWRAVY